MKSKIVWQLSKRSLYFLLRIPTSQLNTQCNIGMTVTATQFYWCQYSRMPWPHLASFPGLHQRFQAAGVYTLIYPTHLNTNTVSFSLTSVLTMVSFRKHGKCMHQTELSSQNSLVPRLQPAFRHLQAPLYCKRQSWVRPGNEANPTMCKVLSNIVSGIERKTHSETPNTLLHGNSSCTCVSQQVEFLILRCCH